MFGGFVSYVEIVYIGVAQRIRGEKCKCNSVLHLLQTLKSYTKRAYGCG
jgi:hypothetical protein